MTSQTPCACCSLRSELKVLASREGWSDLHDGSVAIQLLIQDGSAIQGSLMTLFLDLGPEVLWKAIGR